MSTSDSSEDLERFKESVDSEFLSNDLYNKKSSSKELETKTNNDKLKQLPSLRRNVNEEDEASNFFRVTPEFQKYVAKHLSIKLEKEIELEIANGDNQLTTNQKNQSKKRKGGIKLLYSSEQFIKIPRVSQNMNENNHNIRIQYKFHEFNEEELEEKCKEVSIDGGDILKKKDIKFWSNRSKAEVFNYKKVNGMLEYKEKPFVSLKY